MALPKYVAGVEYDPAVNVDFTAFAIRVKTPGDAFVVSGVDDDDGSVSLVAAALTDEYERVIARWYRLDGIERGALTDLEHERPAAANAGRVIESGGMINKEADRSTRVLSMIGLVAQGGGG